MNMPNTPNDMLLESERKELFGRITVYIGDIFKRMTAKNARPKWNGTEISNKYGLQRSNVTMIQNYKKYKREISSTELTNLLMEGLVTVTELTESCAKSEKEKSFLEKKFRIIRLNEIAKKNKIDAADIIAQHLKDQGIDIGE